MADKIRPAKAPLVFSRHTRLGYTQHIAEHPQTGLRFVLSPVERSDGATTWEIEVADKPFQPGATNIRLHYVDSYAEARTRANKIAQDRLSGADR